MNKKIILIGVVLFLISAIGSYFYFKSKNPVLTVATVALPKPSADGSLAFDKNLPKTQACPLNGEMYSVQQQKWWETHEPLGVMIENSTDARPQSGISYADVVYEAVAEGGITRTLNIYYCQDAPEVGPVRSARVYFMDFLSEYGPYPLYAHVGGANAAGPANALGEISNLGWNGYNDLNQFYIGFPTYWRDYSRQGRTVATEHTMYSTTSKLWAVAKTHGITNLVKGQSWDTNFVPYTFKSDATTFGNVTNVTVPFWGDPGYVVNWEFDPKTDSYLRINGGQKFIDIDTKKPIYAKDVVVLYMKESHAIDGYANNEHLLYQDKGTGNALVFLDGKEITGVWKKASRTGRTLIYDSNGNEVSFNRGQIWFEIVPTYATVTTN